MLNREPSSPRRIGKPPRLDLNFIVRGWATPFLQVLTLSFGLTLTLSGETLETKNPFLPPDHGEKEKTAPPPPVTRNGPINREIEFRGLVKMDGRYQFSLFNIKEQKSYWLYLDQSESGITVRNYDAESRTITVNMNGRSERITLVSASDAPLPVVSSSPQNEGAKNQLPPDLENATKSDNSNNRRRVIPRRRVILPKK